MNLKGMQVVTQDVFEAFVQPSWSFKYEYVTDPKTGKYCALHTGFGPLQRNGIIHVKAITQRLVDSHGVLSKACLYMILSTDATTKASDPIEELLV